MKRVLIIITTLLCVLFTGMMGQTSYAAKKVIAVPGIHSDMGPGGDTAARDFESQLIGALINSGQYDVVERARLEEAMQEIGLGLTGIISTESAVQLGEMTGADYVLSGSLLDAHVEPYNNILWSGFRAKVKFEIRLVDIHTGIIKFSEIVEGSKTAVADIGQNATIGQAVNDAADNVIELLNEKNPLTGTVVHVNDNQVYLDIGSENGVRVGEKFIAYREGKPIIHPVTHEMIAVEENKIGMVKIVDVKSDYAICEISNGKGQIRSGDKVKRGHK